MIREKLANHLVINSMKQSKAKVEGVTWAKVGSGEAPLEDHASAET